ncbi:LCP family protein [Desulfosporosinus youngiae]|uniref:Cell envelope-related function transcriptional attenuator common domain protein n=1 Tax=Desulfosporosinus youngiae DSM 17734 TaxID=768710 RepID=H5XT36_9FIRM|nr:LCP family protein [Desulfosporosinus youngiae]EHQ88143.1 cell envelope-related function transcriptional attenuator common domain protein [Desulfosporosinus youngiae DSM 17734]
MKEKKNRFELLFRVVKVHKKTLFLGFFLGISLVLGVSLANQVIGNETPITLAKAGEGSSQAEKEIPTIDISASNQVNETTIIAETLDAQQEAADEQTEDASQNNNSDPAANSVNDLIDEAIPTFNKKHFTVLLVGVDQRPREKSISNTDTLLVADVNTINGQVTLLSIPRDTQVMIPGYGKEKINAAARLGKGLKTTTALVEEITGQPIDGYVLTNFTGFKTIIDTLGGITLTVEKDMYYMTGDKEDGIINLKEGTQRLNGTQALQYARFRQDALADISRTSRQQAVLKAMGKEFLQVKTLPKLPALISQITKCTETDLTAGELWSMANILLRFKNPNITSQTLPGNFLIEDNISYWKVNPKKSQALVKKLIEEGKTSSVFFQ